MTASPAPSNGPKGHDAEVFIAEHQAHYSEAIDRAREAATTTQTPAWLANYATQVKMHERVVTDQLKSIDAARERIGGSDTNEDDEKAVKDAVKALADERIRFAAWRARAVNVYKLSAEKCIEIKEKAMRAAQNAERESPLINSGLAGRVGAIINKWPDASWDDELGRVEVSK